MLQDWNPTRKDQPADVPSTISLFIKPSVIVDSSQLELNELCLSFVFVLVSNDQSVAGTTSRFIYFNDLHTIILVMCCKLIVKVVQQRCWTFFRKFRI